MYNTYLKRINNEKQIIEVENKSEKLLFYLIPSGYLDMSKSYQCHKYVQRDL